MTDYFRVALGLPPVEPPTKVELVVDVRTLPSEPAPFYTALVNLLSDHGFPIKLHQWTHGQSVCETIAANVSHGTLSWSSFDFRTQIRFTWTSA